jgi:hypothetical protein
MLERLVRRPASRRGLHDGLLRGGVSRVLRWRRRRDRLRRLRRWLVRERQRSGGVRRYRRRSVHTHRGGRVRRGCGAGLPVGDHGACRLQRAHGRGLVQRWRCFACVGCVERVLRGRGDVSAGQLRGRRRHARQLRAGGGVHGELQRLHAGPVQGRHDRRRASRGVRPTVVAAIGCLGAGARGKLSPRNTGTGGETGRRSGFRFHRRKA